jgi:hypothetical protein
MKKTYSLYAIYLNATALILAFLYPSFLFSQTIDSLKTDKEVLTFVRNLNEYGNKLFISPPKRVAGVQDYEKGIMDFGSPDPTKAWPMKHHKPFMQQLKQAPIPYSPYFHLFFKTVLQSLL